MKILFNIKLTKISNMIYLKEKFKNKNFHFIEAPYGESIINKLKSSKINQKFNHLRFANPKAEEIAAKFQLA